MTCRSAQWLVALGVLGGCGDNGPNTTTGLTNNTFPMNTFPSGPDSSDDDPGPDSDAETSAGTSAGTTSDEPTSAGPTSDPTSDPTGDPTSDPSTSAGPTTEPDPTTSTSEPPPDTSDPPRGFCGDGAVDVGEDCDDANFNDFDACLEDCTSASCGDGFMWDGVEGCDDGNLSDGDGCSSECVAESCGDGVVQAGEDCDDGDNSNTDDCLNNCQDASCGDGFVWAGEETCDDGDLVDGDGCDSDCTPSNGQKYTAVGPQTNVPAANLTGWSICHSGPYDAESPTVSSILSACNKANLMLACRMTGSTTYTLLAHAPRSQVITNTGESNTPTNANGSGWYFSDSYSWGFAKQGDLIDRNSCDVGETNASRRLCFHTNLGSMQSGYRCGATLNLFDGTWERVVLHAD